MLGEPLIMNVSHADSTQPTSNSLSDEPEVASIALAQSATLRPSAERSSAAIPNSASQSANAFGVDTPISGVTTTIGIARQIRQRINFLAAPHAQHRSADQKQRQIRPNLGRNPQPLRAD